MHDGPPCCMGAERPACMAQECDPPEGFPLGAREWAVVRELARGDDAQVGFQGLRRRLDLHQETLSRILRRLERQGLVEKATRGYRLTGPGSDLVQRTGRPVPRPHMVTVASALMPSRLSSDTVRARLSGRWFGGLRWYGLAEGPGETVLTWSDADASGLYRLRMAGGAVRIEVATRRDELDRTLAAAAPLVAAVADLLRAPDDGVGKDETPPGAAS